MKKEIIKEDLLIAIGYLKGIQSCIMIEKEAFNGYALSFANNYLKTVNLALSYIEKALKELKNE